MHNETQFKIARGKANFGGSNTVRQLAEVLALNADASSCTELRVLHCPQLAVINGIEACRQLKSLNLSCNAIEDLSPLKALTALESLDVKANRIRSLRGIEDLRRLIRLDGSQNRIETLEGLGEGNAQIQCIILYKNSLRDLGELARLESFRDLREVCFERGSSDRSNPFCLDRGQYFAALQAYLLPSKATLKKLDDLAPKQLADFFENSEIHNEQTITQNPPQHHGHFNQSSHFQPLRSQPVFTHSPSVPLASQKLMLMTQRQMDLQRIIGLKEESLEEMRHRYAQLQLASTNHFREALKREAECERVSGQVAELARGIDLKDQKINELHRRIEELLKTSAASNALADKRSQELETLRRELGEARVESAGLRAVSKQQEGRLRELQGKALANIEEKSQRLEQLRGRQEQTMRENYELRHQQEEYKDRVRELTQLLKEWEGKYEQTVRELEANHHSEKEQIFSEFDDKNRENVRRWEEAQRSLNQEWEDKLNALENQYSGALESALEKYARLKRAFEDKSSTEGELKVLLKSVMAKNTEAEATIKDYEEAIIKTKKAIMSLSADYDALAKEHHEVKGKLESELRHLQGELSKVHFSREKLERQARELRAANEYLQKNLDNLTSHEREFEQLLEKCENLQAALDAKNVMLDDKVETIEALKADLESALKDQEGRVDAHELEKLKDKYRRQKAFVDELSQQNKALKEENTELAERCEVNNFLQQEFAEVKEIMQKQEVEIREKDEINGELVSSLERLKNYSQNLTDEMGTLKSEKNRLLHTIEDKETKWARAMREKDNEHEKKIAAIQEESNKYRQIAEQFKNLTKNLNF